jgi:hypothetical protein
MESGIWLKINFENTMNKIKDFNIKLKNKEGYKMYKIS